jgi:septal ring factor EnvC (AmiA/AmiB activator)
MDWSSIIIGVGSAGGALGLNEIIRAIVNKWANKKKDEMDADEKMFTTFSKINEKLAAEMSDLTQKLIEAHSKTANIINQQITLTMDNADLKTQNELLLMENKQLKKSLGEMKGQIAEMEKQIKELQKKV